MPKVIGIYLIQNIITDEFYVGQSCTIYGRWNSHRKALLNNNHCNPKLQNSYNIHGETAFNYKTLEIISDRDSSKLNSLEIKYLDLYIQKYGQDKCLNRDLKPKEVSCRISKSKHTYYLYDAFGKFINSYNNSDDAAKAMGMTCKSAIFKMVNGWRGYEQYKRIRVKKSFIEKIEPLPDTYVIFEENKVFKFCDSAKDVVLTLQIKGGGSRTNAFNGSLVKKKFRIVPYSKYLEGQQKEILERSSQGISVSMLDAKTRKVLKSFQSIQSALRFLEYPVHLSPDILSAIKNNCTYLNYKWIKND